MFTKLICFILIIQLSIICGSFVPIFFGHDSAVIVDTDQNTAQNRYNALRFTNKIMPAPFPLWRHYPRYQIIPAPPVTRRILPINAWAKTTNPRVPFASTTPTTTSSTAASTTTTTITSTTTPKPTVAITSTLSSSSDEFPEELLDVAQNKLGLKNLDEIPSISEFSQLLGTNGQEETLEYIRELTLNNQGLALLKAFIESSDYTDKINELKTKDLVDEVEDREEDEDEEDELVGDMEQSVKLNDSDLVVVADDDLNDDVEINNEEELIQDNASTTEALDLAENKQSLMARLASYMHINTLNDKAEEKERNEINRITENGKKVSEKEKNEPVKSETKNNTFQNTTLPFNYPIPIRIQTNTTNTTTTTLPSTSATVHLNTPKVLIPHVQQISAVTKIPVKQIEDFVANKPKLLDLVTKVSRFPIGYDRNSPIEAQVVAAVRKAFEEEDDDIKNYSILKSLAETLKKSHDHIPRLP